MSLLGQRPFTNLVPSSHPLHNASVLEMKTHVQESLEGSMALQRLRKEIVASGCAQEWVILGAYVLVKRMPSPWKDSNVLVNGIKELDVFYSEKGMLWNVSSADLECWDGGVSPETDESGSGIQDETASSTSLTLTETAGATPKTSLELINSAKTEFSKEKGKYKRMMDILLEYSSNSLQPKTALLSFFQLLHPHTQLLTDLIRFIDPTLHIPPTQPQPSHPHPPSDPTHLISSYKQWTETPTAKRMTHPPRQRPPPISIASNKPRRATRAGPGSASESRPHVDAFSGPLSAPLLGGGDQEVGKGRIGKSDVKVFAPTIAFNTRKALSRRGDDSGLSSGSSSGGAKVEKGGHSPKPKPANTLKATESPRQESPKPIKKSRQPPSRASLEGDESLPPMTPKCLTSISYIIQTLKNHIASEPFQDPCPHQCGLDLHVLLDRVSSGKYTSPVLFRRDFDAMVGCLREEVDPVALEKLGTYFGNVWDHFFPELIGDRRARRRSGVGDGVGGKRKGRGEEDAEEMPTRRSFPPQPPFSSTLTLLFLEKMFLQTPPSFGNQYTEDPVLTSIIKHRLPASIHSEISADLTSFGSLVAGSQIAEYSKDAQTNLPYVEQYDAWGKRIDRLHTAEGWKQMKRISAEEGLVSIAYERKHGEFSRVHQFAKIYLFAPACAVYTCPLAMTDGAARAIELVGDEEMKQNAYKRLIRYEGISNPFLSRVPDITRSLTPSTSRDPKVFWTSGQWMTEKPGGSDVGRTETTAHQEATSLNLFIINGSKWFSSATDSDMTLLLAREIDATGAAVKGSRGLSLFYAELKTPAGDLNGVKIIRLKNKYGTKPLPTAELELCGMQAKRIGGPLRGVPTVATLLNITRLHSAMNCVGAFRRALVIAKDFASKRE
ncbi:hypothetical protein HDU67_001726, partial [Dinochytrium kinnereticum]